MSRYFTLVIAFAALTAQPLSAQFFSTQVLLEHHFEGSADPLDTMLFVPSGDDAQWVNFDEDLEDTKCFNVGVTPGGWFWESDLGVVNPEAADNYALTSCSWTGNNVQTLNWLITPRIFIPDSSFRLNWKSLSFYGPNLMDGYKVLASTGSNIPEAGFYKDTLFEAAETVTLFGTPYSLDLDDYEFSSGYIHANRYTDTSYYFLDYSANATKPFYHGKLEPHSVSLSKFAGQNIYIAFLHDSHDHDKLQIDDIVISNAVSGTNDITDKIKFKLKPNPASDFAFLEWNAGDVTPLSVKLSDVYGRSLQEKNQFQPGANRCVFTLDGIPSGTYFLTLYGKEGHANQILVKR